MAKPYREGAGWSMRQQLNGERLYVSGHATAAKARKAMAELVNSKAGPQAAGFGARHTSVAQALQDYGLSRLMFQKGAAQEVRRINRYLRACRLDTLVATPREPCLDDGKKKKKNVFFKLSLAPYAEERRIPHGLNKFRSTLEAASAESSRLRQRLACTTMASVTAHQIQDLVKALLAEGSAPATINLERALLRNLFNYARNIWHWSDLTINPAIGLKMPEINNHRNRIMTEAEEAHLFATLVDECDNPSVAQLFILLTETAMRTSEPLVHARWRGVDWDEQILTLEDSKTGQSEVPLSPRAVAALRELAALQGGHPAPDARICEVSYESLKASWQRALARLGIEDLQLRDLRHTAATRMALASGNMFLVMALTRHKTAASVKRYVNIKAKDVVDFMRKQNATPRTVQGNSANTHHGATYICKPDGGRALSVRQTPAGRPKNRAEELFQAQALQCADRLEQSQVLADPFDGAVGHPYLRCRGDVRPALHRSPYLVKDVVRGADVESVRYFAEVLAREGLEFAVDTKQVLTSPFSRRAVGMRHIVCRCEAPRLALAKDETEVLGVVVAVARHGIERHAAKSLLPVFIGEA